MAVLAFPELAQIDWQVIFLICVSVSLSVKGAHSLKIKKTLRGPIIISMGIGDTFVGVGSHGQDSIQIQHVSLAPHQGNTERLVL